MSHDEKEEEEIQLVKKENNLDLKEIEEFNKLEFREDLTKSHKLDIVEDFLNKLGMSRYLLKMIVFGILTCFSDGSEMVVVSLIIRKLETKWNLTPVKKALVGGSIFNGFLIGAILSGKLMDSKGRKFTLVLGSVIFLIFGLISSIATEFYSFMLFRIGVGIGIGFVIPTTQTFLTELSPQQFRGFNSIIIWLGFPMGEMYICYISHLFPLDDQTYHQDNWQLIMILAAVPIFLNIVMLLMIKESPRFHLMKNNFEEAFEILEYLQKEKEDTNSKLDSEDPNHPITSENSPVKNYFNEKIKSELKISYILKKSNSLETGYFSTLLPEFKSLSIKLWILWFSVSYIFYGVLYLIPELVGKQQFNVNFSDLIEAVVFSTFFEIIGILSTLIIESDKIGRLGGFRVSFSLCSIVAFLCIFKFKGWILFLHILKGAIQIPTRALYIYTSECYPTEIRGIAMGLGNSFTRLAGILTPLINELLISVSQKSCFIFLTLASVIGVIISFSLNKETLNKKID